MVIVLFPHSSEVCLYPPEKPSQTKIGHEYDTETLTYPGYLSLKTWEAVHRTTYKNAKPFKKKILPVPNNPHPNIQDVDITEQTNHASNRRTPSSCQAIETALFVCLHPIWGKTDSERDENVKEVNSMPKAGDPDFQFHLEMPTMAEEILAGKAY